MPSKRTLLRTCGIGLGLSLTGCLGTGGDESPDRTTTETTTHSPPTAEEVSPTTIAERGVPVLPIVESTSSKPFRAFAVGNRDTVANPDDNLAHRVWVWNDTDEERAISVTLATGGTTVLDKREEFPTRVPLVIDLREPRPYELTVRAGDHEQTVEIPRSQFDCNHSATDVAVQRDEILDGTITTELACGTTASGS